MTAIRCALRHALRCAAVGSGLALFSVVSQAQEAHPREIALDIKPQSMSDALNDWAQQTGLQLIFPDADIANRLAAPPVRGTYTAQAALNQLLAGTELTYEFINEKTVSIRERHPSAPMGARPMGREQEVAYVRLVERRFGDESNDAEGVRQAAIVEETAAPATDRQNNSKIGVPEILVTGKKVLNMDIERSRDDAQPYVILDRAAIERSGAANIGEFFKQRLPMNAVGLDPSQQLVGFTFGAASQINLRGLGTNQTLILVDGRRLPGVSAGGTPNQPDLNGIPLSAVERIEILPTTASGIYGGSATGGVVNVILRRDYDGAELRVNYGNTFDTKSAAQRVDLSAGHSFRDNKTSLTFAASWSDDDGLQVDDREFRQRGIAKILVNNPGFFASNTTPPLGATTNIRSVSGAPLFGPGTPNFTSVPVGYVGGGGILPFSVNAGTYNFDLAKSAQSSGGGRSSLLGGATVKSLAGTLRREFSPRVEGFLDMAGSATDSSFSISGLEGLSAIVAAAAPNNPFGQAIRVTVPSDIGDGRWNIETLQRRITGGVIARLPLDWSITADYTWNRASMAAKSLSSSASLAAAIGNGTIDVLRDTFAFPPQDFSSFLTRQFNTPYRSTTQNSSMRLAGPVGSLPGGKVIVTALIEHRKDQVGDGTGTRYVDSGPGTPFTATRMLMERSQLVDSAYLEVNAPLISAKNGVRGIQQLELQLAVRTDHYETHSSPAGATPGSTTPVIRTNSRIQSTDPTIALRWYPSTDVMIRASYGTGLLPPSVSDLAPPSGPFTAGAGATLVDPQRGNTPVGTAYQIQAGSNPGLQPEESESWSAGVVVTPRIASDLRLSVDYTQIRKSNNFTTLTGQQLIDAEVLFPNRIVRAPVQPGDPFSVGRITFLDLTALNGTQAEVEAFDTQLDYHHEVPLAGVFDFFALATWQTHFKQQLVPTASMVENVGITSNFPIKFKASAGVTWNLRAWTVGLNTRYYDSYLVADPRVASSTAIILNQGSRRIRSQHYEDLFASYRLGASSLSTLSTADIQLGVKNVFNARPPFDAGSASAGYYSGFGDPRLASYYLAVKIAF